MSAAGASAGSSISESVLRQGRKSGHLNLSSRQLQDIPRAVWRINIDPPADTAVSFGGGEERWWDQTDLTKLILAGNLLTSLSEDVRFLTALTVLDAHDNQIASLPDSLGALQSLNRLVMSRNSLSTLPPSLCTLPALSSLKLDHNRLSELPADLGSLARLEELDVSHNSLSALPDSLGGLTCLLRLTASHNQLSQLPQTIGSLTALKELVLNNNKLTALPAMAHTTNLQILTLQYNSLSQFPLIEGGGKLKELQLGANRLSRLDPVRLVSLTGLVYLDLRENKIQSIPVEITRLVALERLDLSNNDLPGLPNEMGHMAQLKSLLLDGNPLKSLRRDIMQKGTFEILKYMRGRIETPPDHPAHVTTKHTPSRTPPPPRVAHQSASTAGATGSPAERAAAAEVGAVSVEITPDTRKLDLTHGNFTSLPDSLFVHTQLTEIAAGYNRLTAVPPAIGSLCRLSVLDVRNNQLSSLPEELALCVELRDLVLSFNRFSLLPPVLYRLKKLEHIIAENNQITAIDVEGLRQLPMIQTLDLQNNSVAHVPPQLGTISTLKHLQLAGNVFRNPRPSVLARGTAELLQFLRGRIP
jgi:Leucine-rich repeat (LRR) protein